jgi:RNA polymerase sigma-B factor
MMQVSAVTDRAAQDAAGTALAETFAATDPADPDWPALRERVIEAWLPLAQHLTRRRSQRPVITH